MLAHHYPDTEQIFGDITTRADEEMRPVDFYTSTFPCQPFASGGLLLGIDDLRGTLFWHSMNYISSWSPKLVMFENVGNLYKRFKEVYNQIVALMKKMEYIILNEDNPLVNTYDHGVPQNRERLLLFCVHKRAYTNPFQRPKKFRNVIKTTALIHNDRSLSCNGIRYLALTW
jgi:DNA (cytosine-5)-methyltransferase 1